MKFKKINYEPRKNIGYKTKKPAKQSSVYRNVIRRIHTEINTRLQEQFESVPIIKRSDTSIFIKMFRTDRGLSKDEFVNLFNSNEKVMIQAIENAAINVAKENFNAKLLN